jgi:prepilin-type N-terminal cleavage/methylation domain-containing protein
MAVKNRGFTLIEILVVITIIAALMGLGVAMMGKANVTKEAAMTSQTVQSVAAALEQLRSPSLLGDYPPAEMALLRGLKGEAVGKTVGTPNDTNQGIETVYVTLFLSGHNVPVDLDLDKVLANTDGDSMSGNPTRSEEKDLFEFVDAWGNPLAYFSSRDLKKYEAVNKYISGEGNAMAPKPWISEKTKMPLNAKKFQLFSAGPDFIFNTKDDIKNW